MIVARSILGSLVLAGAAVAVALAQAQGSCGGRSSQPQVPCDTDVTRMMAVLPARAPAAPRQPRRILVLAAAQGYVHSSIPLAARTVSEMGRKTGAWVADVTYDAASVTTANLRQYDAIFLDGTTGTFLDVANDPATTQARRAALLEFVRGGKGLAGVHAASDSYHGGAATPGTLRAQPRTPDTPCVGAASGGNGGGAPLWPEFNAMIGGYFKWHWLYPTPITVTIDDPGNPVNAAFRGRSFNIIDEVYTFNEESFSRRNVHVLTSIDYALMTDCDKALEERPRADRDYALSWIRREGKGRVFYQALGHHESIYYVNPPMLEHLLAGIQYVLGDLRAEDSPSQRPAPGR